MAPTSTLFTLSVCVCFLPANCLGPLQGGLSVSSSVAAGFMLIYGMATSFIPLTSLRVHRGLISRNM